MMRRVYILLVFVIFTIIGSPCVWRSDLAQAEIMVAPLFTSMNRFQFYAVVVPYLVREYQRKNVPNCGIRILKEDDPDILASLEGKVAIITGGSRGLGVEVVRTFLRKGAHVITTASSADPKVAQSRIKKVIHGIPEGKWKLEVWHLDLMSMQSVMSFVERFESQNRTRLDYFIGNAGVMFPPYRLSEDGFESQFAINYLSHALLSFHLLPHLLRTARETGQPSRLILVSSCLHHIPSRIRFADLQSKQVYSPHYAYGLSKLAVMMFIYKLNRTLSIKSDWSRQLKVFTLHPGLVDTDLVSTLEIVKQYPALANQFALRSVKEGAETVIYAALSSQLKKKSGEYLEDSQIAQSSRISYNEGYQDRLWIATSRYLAKWTYNWWFEDL